MYCLTPPMSEPPEGNTTRTAQRLLPASRRHHAHGINPGILCPPHRKLELPFVFGPAEREGLNIPEPERAPVVMRPPHSTASAASVPRVLPLSE